MANEWSMSAQSPQSDECHSCEQLRVEVAKLADRMDEVLKQARQSYTGGNEQDRALAMSLYDAQIVNDTIKLLLKIA